jgi:hypothetical protein
MSINLSPSMIGMKKLLRKNKTPWTTFLIFETERNRELTEASEVTSYWSWIRKRQDRKKPLWKR